MLDYSFDRTDSTLVLDIRGTLDATTAPDLEKALKGKLDGVCELVIDLGGLVSISSMGLRLLLALYKHMERQGTMRVINATGMVENVLDATGLADIFALNE